MPRDLSPRARLRRRLRRLVLEPFLHLLRFVVGHLPWRAVQWLGARLGGLSWYLGARDRRRSLEHLAIAFPEMGEGERRRLARRSFRHLGQSVFEMLHAWGRPPQDASRHVEIVGFEVVEALRRAERPILVLTGHCGNWEMISTANQSHDLGLAAMARNLDEGQRVIESFRRHLGSTTLPRGDRRAISGMLRVLRQGGALCMLIDQDIDTDGVWVPFFGRLAHTPTAAAELALRLGAAAVPTFAERLDDGSHRVTFHPPLELPDDVRDATAVMTRAIEKQIRRRPEQWVWMHKRWRRRPPEEAGRAETAEA